MAEFALIAPVMLAIVGATTDVARLYFSWVKLEAATRDAAQYVASDPAYATTGGYYDSTDTTNYCAVPPFASCTTAPSTDAQSVMQTELGGTFTKSSSQSSCTSAKVWAILSTDTATTNGASVTYPLATAHITACYPFRTFIPWPILTLNGTWILRTDRTVTTLVGR